MLTESKISFVIPAYNEEMYIGKCLEAILKQLNGKDYQAQIIVVNNASTDRTEQVARAYPGVTVINEPKKGLVQARTAGLNAAAAELVANIDADSILPAGWMERVFAEFDADKKLVALSGPYVYYDLPDKMNRYVHFYYRLGYFSHLINHFFKKGAMLQGGNFVIKKSAMQKVGGYNFDFSFYGEDTATARRLVKVGHVKFDFKLKMYTSGRRLAHEGTLKMAFKYGMNYIWTTFFGRPFSKDYVDIRPAQKADKK